MVLVVTSYLRIRRKSKESKEMDPSGEAKFAKTRRRSHWPSFFCLGHRGFERVWAGLSGLPCCRSGWSEKRPSIIHDSALTASFSKFFSSLRTDSPFPMRATHTKVDSFEIYRYIDMYRRCSAWCIPRWQGPRRWACAIGTRCGRGWWGCARRPSARRRPSPRGRPAGRSCAPSAPLAASPPISSPRRAPPSRGRARPPDNVRNTHTHTHTNHNSFNKTTKTARNQSWPTSPLDAAYQFRFFQLPKFFFLTKLLWNPKRSISTQKWLKNWVRCISIDFLGN